MQRIPPSLLAGPRARGVGWEGRERGSTPPPLPPGPENQNGKLTQLRSVLPESGDGNDGDAAPSLGNPGSRVPRSQMCSTQMFRPASSPCRKWIPGIGLTDSAEQIMQLFIFLQVGMASFSYRIGMGCHVGNSQLLICWSPAQR